MKNAIKSIIRRVQEEVYEIHLYNVSGSSTFKLYNDYIGFQLSIINLYLL
jgi:hypothetical protein